MQGMWFDVTGASATHGFICEFGSTSSIEASGYFGSVVVEPAGCLRTSNSTCIGLTTYQCSSTECEVQGLSCVPSCRFRTAESCTMDTTCAMNPSSTPATCVTNTCGALTNATCTSNAECRLSGADCVFKTGCSLWLNSSNCN